MEQQEKPFSFRYEDIRVKGVVAYTGYHHPDYTVRFTLDGKDYQFRMIATVPGPSIRHTVSYLQVLDSKGEFVPKFSIKGIRNMLAQDAFGAGIEAAIAIHRMESPPGLYEYVPQAPF